MFLIDIALTCILVISIYQALNDPSKAPVEEVPDSALVDWEDIGLEPW